MSKIIICGDVMQHDIMLRKQLPKKYTYGDTFSDLQDVFKDADAVVCNLETNIIEHQPLQGFPRFNSPLGLLNSLKQSNFTSLITANNHIFDYGIKGLNRTLDNVHKIGLNQVGCLDVNHIKLTSNIKLHAYTLLSNEKIEDVYSQTVCFLHNYKQQIQRCDTDSINIIYLHGGEEYTTTFTQEQFNISNYCLEMGFNIVIWCHSHKVGTIYKTKDNQYIVNGMGNLLSWQQNLDKQIGRILQIDINDDNTTINFISSFLTQTVYNKSIDDFIIKVANYGEMY